MLEEVGGVDLVLQRVLVLGHQFIEEKVREYLLWRVQGEVTFRTPATEDTD